MTVTQWCPKHGFYPKGKCPACESKEISKRSKKYGGVSIHIPPNMRSVK